MKKKERRVGPELVQYNQITFSFELVVRVLK